MNNTYDLAHVPIRNWAEDDRPREKLMRIGKSHLSDAELLAIIIGTGSRKESALDLSQKILIATEHSLCNLGKLSIKDLQKFHGIGEAKAITLIAALELGRRRKESITEETKHIQSSGDAFRFIQPYIGDLPHEEFWILYLNRKNKIIHRSIVGRGGISGTVADNRIIYKTAIEVSASGIIACHNHPSGNINPSDADIRVTKIIADTGKLIEIPLIDHLIITEKAFYSFADNGLI